MLQKLGKKNNEKKKYMSSIKNIPKHNEMEEHIEKYPIKSVEGAKKLAPLATQSNSRGQNSPKQKAETIS
jgi:hypothetical protein